MSARGKKVNRNNPKVKQERAARKRAASQKFAEDTAAATAGISPREEAPVDLSFSETPRTGIVAGEGETTPTFKLPLESKEMSEEDKAAVRETIKSDVGKSEKGKAARREAAAQRKADAAIVAESNREKTPAEQERADAEAAGLDVKGLRNLRAQGPAAPAPTPNFVPVDVPAAEVDQTKGASWIQGTKAGIFTPAPTGAIRGNRAQPASAEVESNREERIASGMGISGLEEGVEREEINHPVYGKMEVPSHIAMAHRLYSLDFENNPGKANRLAGLSGDEDFASPYDHKGGHYERLARLQAAGESVDDVKSYAKKMNMTEYDAVEGKHALLQDRIDSSRPVDFGAQHLHPADTFIHPETGEEHPIADWEKHGMPSYGKDPRLDELDVAGRREGAPALIASKGTNTSVYKDASGKMRTTIPTHIGWTKTFDTKVPEGTSPSGVRGTWRYQGQVALSGAAEGTKAIPAYDYTVAQARESIPVGSKQSRAQIAEATRAMAQIHAASAGAPAAPARISQTRVTNPSTGLPLAEPEQVETTPQETTVTTSEPAEDATVYKRKGRGKNVIKDINHLVSQQMATTVGGGPVTGTGIVGRDASFGRLSMPLESTRTEGSEAFQPGKEVVAGTAEQNLDTSEAIANQDPSLTKGPTRGNAEDFKPEEAPSFYVDASGNPLPKAPKVGRPGQKPLFVRGRTTNAPRGARQQSLLASFTPVHGLGSDVPGPAVTSGFPAQEAQEAVRNEAGDIVQGETRATPASPGMQGWDTPLTPKHMGAHQWTLPGMGQEIVPGPMRLLKRGATEKENVYGPAAGTISNSRDTRAEAEAELAKLRETDEVKPTMTAAEARKFSRIYLEDNPDKGPAQPMLDFGAEEREEEQKRREASQNNGGIDSSTGKRFRRSGEQWGFLDPRLLGNVESQDSEVVRQATEGSNTKAAEKPRNPVPAPSGIAKASEAPVSLRGVSPTTPAGQRIIGEMRDNRSGKQLEAIIAKMRGETSEAE